MAEPLRAAHQSEYCVPEIPPPGKESDDGALKEDQLSRRAQGQGGSASWRDGLRVRATTSVRGAHGAAEVRREAPRPAGQRNQEGSRRDVAEDATALAQVAASTGWKRSHGHPGTRFVISRSAHRTVTSRARARPRGVAARPIRGVGSVRGGLLYPGSAVPPVPTRTRRRCCGATAPS